MTVVRGATRRNLTALGAAAVLLVGTYVVYPDPIAQYGAWLVVFTIWMAWFVLTGIEWLSKADF
jgi:hypothetical protein